MSDRKLDSWMTRVNQRVTRLERKLAKAFGNQATPYGVAVPFFGPREAIPRKHIAAEGQTVSRTEYARLFEVFGTYYGAGDGSTTFVLPDARMRTLVGYSAGDSDFGEVGNAVGTKTHTLTAAQMPSHIHGYPGGGGVLATARRTAPRRDTAPGAASGSATWVPALGSENTISIETATTAQGGGGAHNNLQPSITCTWILRY